MTRWLPAAVLALVGACAGDDTNFSQAPGFEAWYAAHPPAETVPEAADQALLARFQPRFHLPEGHEGPLDFYSDYLAAGTLRDGEGVVVPGPVSRAALNRIKHDPHAVFVHEPAGHPPTPVVYGRVDRDELELPGCAPLAVTFLTYHLVFRTSGLPAAMTWWQEAPLALAGDLHDWHQLDHYTAVTLALVEADRDARPFAATLQHHNYMRTWLLGEAARPGALGLPDDGRIGIDVAIRSNELYPHRPGRTVRRAVRYLDPASAVYLVTGEDRPLAAADDITHPAREITPGLRFLPPADAFYVFEGWLGERRLLPGRSGPPGADYNAIPAFKPKATQLVAFYWREDDLPFLDLLAGIFADGRPAAIDLQPLLERFAAGLREIRPALASCSGTR